MPGRLSWAPAGRQAQEANEDMRRGRERWRREMDEDGAAGWGGGGGERWMWMRMVL